MGRGILPKAGRAAPHLRVAERRGPEDLAPERHADISGALACPGQHVAQRILRKPTDLADTLDDVRLQFLGALGGR